MVDENTFTPYRPFNSIKECYDEMAKHYPFGLLTNGKKYRQVVEIFEGTFNICYIVIPKEKTLVNLTFTDAFNNYQFVDGSKFGIQDYYLETKTTKIYTVHVNKVFAPIDFIKTIKETLHLNLKEAKNIADETRKETHCIDNLSKEEAEKIAKEVNACGGDAFVEETTIKHMKMQLN